MTRGGRAALLSDFFFDSRFLEVDSWNDVHGIDITKDQCEEKHVEEMKAVQEEGDKRRAVIKKGFQSGEEKLGGIDKELEELSKRIEATAAEAERAAKSEQATSEASDASSNRAKNPFSEYRDQVKELEGKPAGEASGMRGSILQMDDSSAKSRMERLKAESDLLRKCLKDGSKGNFSSYSTTLAGK